MKRVAYRAGLLLAAAPWCLPWGGALAQDSAPAPAPAPPPAPAPQVFTPPTLDRFSLQPEPSAPMRAPSPAPVDAPAAVPPVVPTITATPTPTATPEQARRAEPRQREAAPPPAPAPPPTRTEPAQPAPTLARPAPQPAADEAAATASLDWIWWALGGGAAILLAAGLSRFGRKRAGERRPETPSEAIAAQPAEVPAPVGPSVVPSHPLAPPPPSTSALEVALVPRVAGVGGPQSTIEFELTIANRGGEPAEEVRVVLGVISANPEQDRLIGSFHAGATLARPAPPFALAPGQAHRLSGRLALPRDAIHVVTAAGRPMFVPVVLVNLRWRSGLSLRNHGEAHMIGIAPAQGEGGKLGPFWLDRGERSHARLAARRYS